MRQEKFRTGGHAAQPNHTGRRQHILHQSMEERDNILIVDDRGDNLVALETALKPLGVTAVTALSGVEALRASLNHCFALAIIDARMPGMDGYELAELLRGQPETRDMPIIFLTAADHDECTVAKAYRSGAVDFLFKPLNRDILLGKVGIFLELYRKKRALADKVAELLAVKEQLELANRTLTDMSFVDGLTGIRNRRYFDETLTREWKRAVREKTALSVIMADIDGFKSYNDLYGHLEGDECLRKIAKALAAAVRRPADFVARFGGEEFSVVLPETREDGAAAMARDILAIVRAMTIPHASSIVPGVDRVTVSLGVATAFPAEGSSMDQVMAAADKSLYEAKRSGRDRAMAVQCHTDCLPAEEGVSPPATTGSPR
jgi:diguanylate cyclase (GGDEF)-like protein